MRRNSKHAGGRTTAGIAVFVMLAALTAGCLTGQGDDGEEGSGLSVAEAELQVNPGAWQFLFEELRTYNAGKFPAVMRDRATGCVATVIGPYAVATAYHCIGKADLSDNPGADWSNLDLAGAEAYGNPYAVNKRYFEDRFLPVPPEIQNDPNVDKRPFPPQWLRDAWPDADTVWGRAFDIVVKFVPGLTPELIAASGMRVVQIDPYALGGNITQNDFFTIVGYYGASNRTTGRQYGLTQYRWPNPVRLSRGTGAIEFDRWQPGMVYEEQGDSGSPTLLGLPWNPGDSQVLVSVTSSTHAAAPTLYQTGWMHPEQLDAVRLNSLWLAARRDDPDGDGVPAACDASPTVRDPAARTALCPGPIGYPSGGEVIGYPEGSLVCSEGSVLTGIRGRHSTTAGMTNGFSVRCSSEGCFDGGVSGPCVTSWSDRFGLEERPGDATFQYTCPIGRWAIALAGKVQTFSGEDELMSLSLLCHYPGSTPGWPTSSPEYGAAASPGASPFPVSVCPDYQPMRGVIAHSRWRDYLTGLMPVCRAVP